MFPPIEMASDQQESMSETLVAVGRMVEAVRLAHAQIQPSGLDAIPRTPSTLAELLNQNPTRCRGDRELPENLEVADSVLRRLLDYLSNGTVSALGNGEIEVKTFLEDAPRIFDSMTRRVGQLRS